MKKALVIVFCLLIVLQCVGCVSKYSYEQVKIENEELKEKNEDLQKQVDHLEYMAEIMSTPTPTTAPPVDATKAIKDIEITIYGPNTAGGIDMYISAFNSSQKTIKYAILVVTPYNAVGDEVQCEISRESTIKLRITGPEEPEDTFSGMWETVWYNSTITTCALEKVTLEYMDGSTIEIPKSAIDVIGVEYQHRDEKFW